MPAASSRCCRSSRASGKPIVFHAGQADADILSPDVRTCTPTATSSTPSGSRSTTPTSTAPTPFDANALAKTQGRHAVQAPGERRVPARHRLQASSTSTRPATPTRTPRPARPSAASAACSSSTQTRPSPNTASCRCFYLGDVAHAGLRQHRLPDERPGRLRRGRRRRAARPAQRARLGATCST